MTTVSGTASFSTFAPAGAPPAGPRDWGDHFVSLASPGGALMRAAQPVLAEALRRSGAGAGTEWGASLQRVLDDPRSVPAFQAGMREGALAGAKAMVEGAWGLAAGVAKTAYNVGPLGWLVEGAQRAGVLGEVPGWIPDAGRVTERAAAIGGAIADYAAAAGRDPAKLAGDVKGWIANNWNALKADHARAAAQGGAAEARWWGQVTGRATFEVAAMAVPVTKFATVAQAGRALQTAVKAGKLGEAFTEAARVGRLAELFSAAAKMERTADLVAEARAAGRLDELVTAARGAPDGVRALAGEGGLTMAEARRAGGTLAVEMIALRKATAKAFYEAAGWPEKRIASHMGGIDFTKPVTVVELPRRLRVTQHLVPGAPVGNYFAPVGTPAPRLGINPAGRVATDFMLNEPVRVLRSTAAPITDTWTMPGTAYKAEGGGTQFFTRNPDSFEKVR